LSTEVSWEHDFCGCFDNCGICIITYIIPCYTAGKVAEKVGDSCCLCGLVLCVPIAGMVFGACIRKKVRDQKGISGTFCGDLMAWFCCPCCALVQEAQEVKAIGSESMAQYGGIVMERA